MKNTIDNGHLKNTLDSSMKTEKGIHSMKELITILFSDAILTRENMKFVFTKQQVRKLANAHNMNVRKIELPIDSFPKDITFELYIEKYRIVVICYKLIYKLNMIKYGATIFRSSTPITYGMLKSVQNSHKITAFKRFKKSPVTCKCPVFISRWPSSQSEPPYYIENIRTYLRDILFRFGCKWVLGLPPNVSIPMLDTGLTSVG